MRVRLDQYWMDYMAGLPESGMGFHLVDVGFESGKVLKSVVVLNSQFIELPDAYHDAKIAEMKIHKD